VLRSGEQFAGYEIRRHLGRGAYGDVYHAVRQFDDRQGIASDVALKIPYDQHLDRDVLLKEAQLWRACSQHSNIVRL
jgi:serine/threonine protein kinase